MEETNQLEKNKNPDWKQWIPFYGFARMNKDCNEGKPSFINYECPYRDLAIVYHSTILTGAGLGVLGGLIKLLY